MGMTIDEAIEFNKNLKMYMEINDEQSEYKFLEENHEALDLAIDTMRKYQKITKILNSASYTENGTVYSYTYDEDTRVKHIREVLEDE